MCAPKYATGSKRRDGFTVLQKRAERHNLIGVYHQPNASDLRDLSETACFAFSLEQSQNVALLDGALNVTDDAAGGIVDELHANLCDTTTRAGAAEDLCDAAELGLGLHLVLEAQ